MNYLAARSGSSARERAGTHARASLIELLTRVCVRVRVRRKISGAEFPKLMFLDHVVSGPVALPPLSGTCPLGRRWKNGSEYQHRTLANCNILLSASGEW